MAIHGAGCYNVLMFHANTSYSVWRIGNSKVKKYQNNIQIGEKLSTEYPWIHQIYRPLFKRAHHPISTSEIFLYNNYTDVNMVYMSNTFLANYRVFCRMSLLTIYIEDLWSDFKYSWCWLCFILWAWWKAWECNKHNLELHSYPGECSIFFWETIQ